MRDVQKSRWYMARVFTISSSSSFGSGSAPGDSSSRNRNNGRFDSVSSYIAYISLHVYRDIEVMLMYELGRVVDTLPEYLACTIMLNHAHLNSQSTWSHTVAVD